MSRLLVPFADQQVEIPSLTAGNIALTVGLKQVGALRITRHVCFAFRPGYSRFLIFPFKTVTGDTIVSSKASAAAAAAARRAHSDGTAGTKRGEQSGAVLSGVEVPDPVFFCTIEPPTMAKQAGQSQR